MKVSYNKTFRSIIKAHLISQAPTLLWAGAVAALLLAGGCKKFLHIPLPANAVAGSDAYAADQTTSGVLNGIYTNLPLVRQCHHEYIRRGLLVKSLQPDRGCQYDDRSDEALLPA
jgi:hypothetical protein